MIRRYIVSFQINYAKYFDLAKRFLFHRYTSPSLLLLVQCISNVLESKISLSRSANR